MKNAVVNSKILNDLSLKFIKFQSIINYRVGFTLTNYAQEFEDSMNYTFQNLLLFNKMEFNNLNRVYTKLCNAIVGFTNKFIDGVIENMKEILLIEDYTE